jgi:hypothetical protein
MDEKKDALAIDVEQDFEIEEHIGRLQDMASAFADDAVANRMLRALEGKGPVCHIAWRRFLRPKINAMIAVIEAEAEELGIDPSDDSEENVARYIHFYGSRLMDFMEDIFAIGQRNPDYVHFEHNCDAHTKATELFHD